jgi:hypothetical protein
MHGRISIAAAYSETRVTLRFDATALTPTAHLAMSGDREKGRGSAGRNGPAASGGAAPPPACPWASDRRQRGQGG